MRAAIVLVVLALSLLPFMEPMSLGAGLYPMAFDFSKQEYLVMLLASTGTAAVFFSRSAIKRVVTVPVVLAIASFFPLTAMLHHAVFFRPTCMVNPFWTPTSTNMEILVRWLTEDPSPYLGLIGAALTYVALRLKPKLALYVLAGILVTTPLSIWVWDLPFTGRIVCWTLHDDRTFLKGRHLYLLAVLAFFPVLYALRRKHHSSIST